jgi:hypothetical protein
MAGLGNALTVLFETKRPCLADAPGPYPNSSDSQDHLSLTRARYCVHTFAIGARHCVLERQAVRH